MSTITRAKLIRDDLSNYDGQNRTVSRFDATGGTVSGLTIGDWVDVLQVFGSGTTRTAAIINSALTSLGTSNTVGLIFSTGTWTIDADVTVPSNLGVYISPACVFAISTGITLTFNGPVHVAYGLNDGTGWYTETGTGIVVCNIGATGYPGW